LNKDLFTINQILFKDSDFSSDLLMV